MRKEFFMPRVETEARLLLLINAFTSENKSLEGRTKLAKLDFFLRYPHFMARALDIRKPGLSMDCTEQEKNNIENRMMRYRYGPWDPSYYAILGRLIGKKLVEPIPITKGIGYRTTQEGKTLAENIATDENWKDIALRIKLLKKHFDLKGSNLKDFIYKHFPEVSDSSWGEFL